MEYISRRKSSKTIKKKLIFTIISIRKTLKNRWEKSSGLLTEESYVIKKFLEKPKKIKPGTDISSEIKNLKEKTIVEKQDQKHLVFE